MTQIKQIERLMDDVLKALPPMEYIKMDDIKIDLLLPDHKINLLQRAFHELELAGKVDRAGNSIRLNQ